MKTTIARLLIIPLFILSCSPPKECGKLKIEILNAPNSFPFNTFDTIKLISNIGNEKYNKSIGFSRVTYHTSGLGIIKLDSIPYGNYSIEYRDNFLQRIYDSLVIDKHINHKYIDMFAINEQSKENLIDKLTQNDTLIVLSKRNYCTSGPINYYPIILFKKENKTFCTINNRTRQMTEEQISYFKKFEQIIRKLNQSERRSTTYDVYQMIFKEDTVIYIDGSSSWDGYHSLYKELKK